MGASPKTTDFLKECMADALLKLMKEKQFSKITISEISCTAGVNRSTWFRNFDTKNETLTFKLVQLWHRWADEHVMQERHHYTLNYQVMMPQHGADSSQCYKARFYSYGLFGLLDECIKRGFHETTDEMAHLVNEII